MNFGFPAPAQYLSHGAAKHLSCTMWMASIWHVYATTMPRLVREPRICWCMISTLPPASSLECKMACQCVLPPYFNCLKIRMPNAKKFGWCAGLNSAGSVASVTLGIAKSQLKQAATAWGTNPCYLHSQFWWPAYLVCVRIFESLACLGARKLRFWGSVYQYSSPRHHCPEALGASIFSACLAHRTTRDPTPQHNMDCFLFKALLFCFLWSLHGLGASHLQAPEWQMAPNLFLNTYPYPNPHHTFQLNPMTGWTWMAP